MSRRIVYLKMVLEDYLLLIRHVDLVRKHAIEDWIAQAKHQARAEGEVNVDASLDQPQAAVRLVYHWVEAVDRMIRGPERHAGSVLHEYTFHLRHYCNEFGHVFDEHSHMQILNCRVGPRFLNLLAEIVREDRKSTRLNSSHLVISYAVFCLKKKNTKRVKPTVSMHRDTHAI